MSSFVGVGDPVPFSSLPLSPWVFVLFPFFFPCFNIVEPGKSSPEFHGSRFFSEQIEPPVRHRLFLLCGRPLWSRCPDDNPCPFRSPPLSGCACSRIPPRSPEPSTLPYLASLNRSYRFPFLLPQAESHGLRCTKYTVELCLTIQDLV